MMQMFDVSQRLTPLWYRFLEYKKYSDTKNSKELLNVPFNGCQSSSSYSFAGCGSQGSPGSPGPLETTGPAEEDYLSPGTPEPPPDLQMPERPATSTEQEKHSSTRLRGKHRERGQKDEWKNRSDR